MKWFRRKVQKGTSTGQKIGYPTLNFHVGKFGQSYHNGVYVCDVQIAGKLYKGALYFGPRLSHLGKVLEIYVIGFNKKIYGQFIQFHIHKKIRGTKTFNNLDDLKRQIQEDLLNI